MSALPTASKRKGEIIVQPSYFTSSLFVDPLRQDITKLIVVYTVQYGSTTPTQPFSLFLSAWSANGWPWLHFKVFDPRSRATFLSTVMRLFLERVDLLEPPINRVVALFGLYTFYTTQPTPAAPYMFFREHVPIPVDVYASLNNLPNSLKDPHLLPLRNRAIYVLSKLADMQIFHFVPPSSCFPLNPRELPREVFVPELSESESGPLTGDTSVKSKKKGGRPTKRELTVRAKEQLKQLDEWLDKTAHSSQDGEEASLNLHALLANAPDQTRQEYRACKTRLLDKIYAPESDEIGVTALKRANDQTYARIKRIDELAAEKGLEVGGAAGDRTALARVERARLELGRTDVGGRRGGILGLIDGAGQPPLVNSNAACPTADGDVVMDSE